MSVLGAFEQMLKSAISELDDRLNGRVEALEERVSALESAKGTARATASYDKPVAKTARAATATGRGTANG